MTRGKERRGGQEGGKLHRVTQGSEIMTVFGFYSKNKKKLGGIFTEGYSQDLIVFLEAHAGYLGVQPHWI